ncbi:MAG TPA: GAF and ANTAR domain-containing protein [Pilimelia sp.]|nr:GAF and ANTAR domain-containing protein [Pilimelia sp.]
MIDNGLHVVETVALLRELTARLLASEDLDAALDALVDTTTQALSGPAWCGVTLLRDGGTRTVAATEPLVSYLDEGQYRRGDGPCLVAIRERTTVVSHDLRVDARWPGWGATALAHGVHGVLCAPIEVASEAAGSLNLYAGAAGAIDARAQLTVALVAEHAGLLLSAVIDRSRQAATAAELREALAYGEVVNQAVGVVLAQRGCSAAEALEVLRQAATTLATPLPEVARRLVDSVAGSRR